jgi:hypothetical protein
MGGVGLAGCGSKEQAKSEASLEPTKTHSEDLSSQSDTSSGIKSVPASLRSQTILDERHGVLHLDKNNPYYLLPVPPEPPETGKNCYILEYSINRRSSFLSERDLDVRLIAEFEKENYKQAAADKQNCFFGLCTEYDEMETFDSSVDDSLAAARIESNRYKRVLLDRKQYCLVLDATDIWSGEHSPGEFGDFELDVSLRIMEDNLSLLERESHKTLSSIARDMTGNQCKTLNEIGNLSDDICTLNGAQELGRRSLDEFGDDISQLSQYSEVLRGILEIIDQRYAFSLGNKFVIRFMRRFESLLNWGSSVAPVAGTLIQLCSDACAVAGVNCSNTVDTAERRAKDFVVSLFSLVVEILMLWYGFSAKIASSTIRAADGLILGLTYIRNLVGGRVYGIILSQAARVIEEALGDTVDYIQSILRKGWKNENDGEVVDSLDADTLVNIGDDNIPDWKQLDRFFDDRGCWSLVATSGGKNEEPII